MIGTTRGPFRHLHVNRAAAAGAGCAALALFDDDDDGVRRENFNGRPCQMSRGRRGFNAVYEG